MHYESDYWGAIEEKTIQPEIKVDERYCSCNERKTKEVQWPFSLEKFKICDNCKKEIREWAQWS